MSAAADHNLLGRLTPAERQVALCLIEGLSNKEIGAVLGKAEATIKHQVGAILAATQAASRTQFVALYYRQLLDDATRRGAPASAGSRVSHPIFAAPDRAAKRPEQCVVCAAAGSHAPAAVACG